MKRGIKAFFGALLLVLGLVAATTGGFVAVLVGPDGEISAPAGNVSGEGYALIFNEFTVDTAGDPNTVRSVADFQVAARSTDNQMVFMGIGPSAEVNRYLSGSARDVVSDLSDGTARVVPIPGGGEPADPTEQDFWDAQDQGLNPVLSLDQSGVNQSLVIMNLDTSEAVSVNVTLGLVSAALFPAALGVLILGVALIMLGVWLLVRAGRKPTTGSPEDAVATPTPSPSATSSQPTEVLPTVGDAPVQTDVTDARFATPAVAKPGAPGSDQTNG